MNLSRRFIVLAALVIVSAVSLGLAGTAKAYGLKAAEEECASLGGTFETHFDSESHAFIGWCTTLECSIKVIQLPRLTILYPSCKTRTVALGAEHSVR
jgi:hypothetical protein